MNRFWESIIKPIFEERQVRNIIEIGSQNGYNTSKILEYCEAFDGHLYCIDPVHPKKLSEWIEKFGSHLTFYPTLSLSALPLIDNFDAVLIDGDHNWYTVINELEILESKVVENNISPVIFLHDIGWPYGRRDLYYNPSNIPGAYIQAYSKNGVVPGESNLNKEGLNSHLNNSIYENNPRNGVLTAVEDFLKKTHLEFEFYKIPAFHGLGILTFGKRKLKLFESDAWYNDLLSGMEKFRIDQILKQEQTSKRLNEAKKNVEDLNNEKIELQLKLKEHKEDFDNKLEIMNDEVRKLTEIKIKNINDIHELKNSIGNKNKEIESLALEKSSLYKTVTIKDQKISELTKSNEKFRQEVIAYRNEIRKLEVANGVHLNSIKYQLGEAFVAACTSPKQALLLPLKLSKLIRQKRERKKTNFGQRKYRDKKQNLIQEGYEKKSDVELEKVELDIVICVHNALDDVKDCVYSVLKNTSVRFRIVIVNDGSEDITKNYLDSIERENDNIIVIHNKEPLGYTIAANKGLRYTNSEYVILLNSDTIVSLGWEKNMIDCIENDNSTGIVGPLSNAASWQSVPDIFDKDGDWMVNELPKGLTNEQMSNLVKDCSLRIFPEVTFVNGFCFMIKRAVIEKIGYLDEDTFPKGYGEENDYCIRAREAGFSLKIADNSFVYHRKSKSFTHDTRKVLAKNAKGLLREKHGDEKIDALLKGVKHNMDLPRIRERIAAALSAYDFRKNFNVLFILPAKGGGGGAHSVIQEARGLMNLGLEVKVISKLEYRDSFLSNYPEIKDICLFYTDELELAYISSKFSIVVATVYHSVQLLKRICQRYPSIIPAYYIQDYEAWFFDEVDPRREEAESSYELIPDIIAFAKTDWIREIVQEKHGLFVHKVSPSLDTDLYYLDHNTENGVYRENAPVTITAMIRPSSPRRSPRETLQVLYEIEKKYHSKVEIHFFGCSEEELQMLLYNQEFASINYYNHGVLKRNQVSDLLKKTDIFLDMSSYQAFGRTGLEAMAVGCAVVLPKTGGTSEYAVNEKNSFLVDTLNLSEAISAVSILVEDYKVREKIISEGLKTASLYSIEKAATSELELFKNIFDSKKKTDKLIIGAIFTKTKNNGPTGSSYHRVVLPLDNLSMDSKDTVWFPLNPLNVIKFRIDILIIQRNSIQSLDMAKSLMEYCDNNNVKTVFEIDDHLIGDDVAIPTESKDIIQYLMKNVQLITVSSFKLEEQYSRYNKNTKLIPNAFIPDIFSERPEKQTGKRGKIKIGYLGTPTHYEDLKVVEQVVIDISKEYKDDVCFEIIGQDFPGFNRLDVPFATYPNFIKTVTNSIDWDFAIAPLAISEFNYYKSYLKYVDYTGLKLPAIYSKGFDYDKVIQNEFNGLLAENTYESWYNAISKFINDLKLRDLCLRNAIEDIQENHLINKINIKRKQLFRDLVN